MMAPGLAATSTLSARHAVRIALSKVLPPLGPPSPLPCGPAGRSLTDRPAFSILLSCTVASRVPVASLAIRHSEGAFPHAGKIVSGIEKSCG